MKNALLESKPRLLLVAGGVAAVLLVLQQFVSIGGKGWTPMLSALNNAAHVPWFACITGLIWLVLPASSQRALRTLMIACAVAVVSESAQYFSPRDASLGDLALNLVAAAATTAVLCWRWPLKVLGAVVLVVATLFHPGAVALSMLERAERWPDLLVADNNRARELLRALGESRWQPPPADWGGVEHDVLWFEFAWRNWSGVHLHSLDRSWAPFSELVVDVYVPGDVTIELYLSTQLEGGEPSERSRRFNLAPGSHRLSVPVEDVTHTDKNVRSLYIYGDTEQTGNTLLIGGASLR